MAFSPDPQFEHLLRRAGFGARPDELETYPQALAQRGARPAGQLRADPRRCGLEDRCGGLRWRDTCRGRQPGLLPTPLINDARQRWLFRMVHTDRPLQEKMTLFWHNHFATAYSKVAGLLRRASKARATWRRRRPRIASGVRGQIEMLRDNALGNFRDLLVAVAQDVGDARVAGWPPEHTRQAAGELRPRADGALHDGRRQLHRGGRLRGRPRLHRLEPDATASAQATESEPLPVHLQRGAARSHREDLQLRHLSGRRKNDSGPRGRRGDAGRPGPDQRAGARARSRRATWPRKLYRFFVSEIRRRERLVRRRASRPCSCATAAT